MQRTPLFRRFPLNDRYTRFPAAAKTKSRRPSCPICNRSHSNRLPVWLTVCIISRDVVIILTVAAVNLAIGRRMFRPSIYGKIATATYIVTAVAAILFNYLDYHSVIVDLGVFASLAITVISVPGSSFRTRDQSMLVDRAACSSASTIRTTTPATSI